jgi:alanyl-tRNA synthetase
MNTADIRQAFLRYFQSKRHIVVESSPLVPATDPSLLFTNAGMVQFKDVFLGSETRPYQRAVSIQRCVRAGGKHNDLENVGYTARHHTFFEMLGNFSFGDYFKREAILFAWEFLTQELGLPAERLWITVFETDEEAADIWLKEIGINPERLSRLGEKDNFWAMGDTGPCGPCTEIFYDHGPEIPGGPPGSPDADEDRYIEIWNLVFMQYNRDKDGNLTPLPAPSVDTGSGLERLAAVLQGVHNNYDIDLFRNLLTAILHIIKNKAGQAQVLSLEDTSLRVIADHIRSAAFLIVDGVIPSNEGRGYVLRRIIRRALRHGHKLGVNQPFFHQLVAPLVTEMGEAYPALAQRQGIVEQVLLTEEQQFAKTLSLGMKLFEQELLALHSQTIPGDVAFRLYDTYGFPVDLTADIARERGYTLDYTAFQTCMEQQRKQSQAASGFSTKLQEMQEIEHYSEFAGYERLEDEVTVVALLRDGTVVDCLRQDEAGQVILKRTPFFAESGGQVGDQGMLTWQNGCFIVDDTRAQQHAHLHIGRLDSGELKVGQVVTAAVDGSKRQATAMNHTATHLLHAALRKILGTHVLQKGSLVAPDRLRFDFAHFTAISETQLTEIEHLVNQTIRLCTPVVTQIMNQEEAKTAGAMALFGEKYSEEVRVLTVGAFSKELCGGTHVRNTGEIGLFKMISEGSIASGVRRIEAVTGEAALQWLLTTEQQLKQCAQLLNCEATELASKIQGLTTKLHQQEKELEQSRMQGLSARAEKFEAHSLNGVSYILEHVDNIAPKDLRLLVDQIKNSARADLVAVFGTFEQKLNIVVGVPTNVVSRLHANDLIKFLSPQIGGQGGGSPQLAQAGGSDPAQLEQALHLVKTWLQQQAGK